MEPLGQRQAVVLVVHPMLADRVADPEHRSAEDLAAERVRMDHGTDVGNRHVVDDLVLAGFDVDLDFSEGGDKGMRDAVALVRVARNAHQPLPCERRP
jgi:hypothetical protein